MSHRAWPELLLVLSSVLVAGAVAAQQAPSEAPAGAQAPSSPTPASTAEQPAKTEASSAPMSSATSAAQPAAAAAPAGPSPELIKEAKSNGYKIKVVRGQTRFCKSETPIGTHFPTETCMNEDQLRLSMQQAQQARDSMTQSMGATK